jgi:hypothetical protein
MTTTDTETAPDLATQEVETPDSQSEPERNPTYQELGFCTDELCNAPGPHPIHARGVEATQALSGEEVADTIAGWREDQASQAAQQDAEDAATPISSVDANAALLYWQGRAYFTEAFLEQEFGVHFVNTLRSRRRPAVPRLASDSGEEAITLPIGVTRVLNKMGAGKEGVPMCVVQMQCELDDAMPYIAELTRLIDKEHIRVSFSHMDPTMVQRSYIEGGDRHMRVDLAPPIPPSCSVCNASSLDVPMGQKDGGTLSEIRCLSLSDCDERVRQAQASFEASLNLGDDVEAVDGEQADEQRAEDEDQSLRDDNAIRQEQQEDDAEETGGIIVNGAAADEDFSQDAPPPKLDPATEERIAATNGRPPRARKTSPQVDREATVVGAASTDF